eukprot:m.32506 g.32506  ORF g.32506 m.32506 type:complete len:1004 (+) comp14132_c0_seq2:353-3364(+)
MFQHTSMLCMCLVLLSAFNSLAALKETDVKPNLDITPYGKPQSSHIDSSKLLLVGTVDGHLHAIDKSTGKSQWSFNQGPLLQSDATDLSHEFAFLPDLRDGSLYYTTRESNEVRKLSKSVQQLVYDAPLFAGDGNVYLGLKRSTMYAIDPSSGRIRQQYSPTDLESFTPPSMEDSLFIGRTEYTIIVRNTETSKVMWNMTVAEYSNPMHQQTVLEDNTLHSETRNARFLARTSADGHRGGLTYFDASEQDSVDENMHGDGNDIEQHAAKWDIACDSPIVSIFNPTRRASGRPVRLARVPLTHMDALLGIAGNSAIKDASASTALMSVLYAAPDGLNGGTQHLNSDVGVPVGALRVLQAANGALYVGASSPDTHAASALIGTETTHMNLVDDNYDDNAALSIQYQAPGCFHGSTDASCFVGPKVVLPGVLLLPGDMPPMDVINSDGAAVTDTMDEDNGDALPVSSLLGFLGLWMDDNSLAVFVTLAAGMAVLGAVAGSARRHHLFGARAAGTPGGADTGESESNKNVDTSAAPDSEDNQSFSGAFGSSGGDGAGSAGTKAPTHQETTAANGTVSIGKITMQADAVLGRGSMGTIVYKGTYDGHDIAVKRMLSDYYELAKHEVDLLRKSDDHPNVIRYFCMEQGSEFLYIGLELCCGTFVNVVEGPAATSYSFGAVLPVPNNTDAEGCAAHHTPSAAVLRGLDRRQLAFEFLHGLAHLHALRIVHRDVKPHNVLLSQRHRAVLSDFGLCKLMTGNHSSFHTENVGTAGWLSPEMLLNRRKKAAPGDANHLRTTRAVDVFAAGCVVHYLFAAVHPFGDHYEREKHIRNKKAKVNTADPLCDMLVQQMIRAKPERRATVHDCLTHPFFWSAGKQLSFLTDVSDRLETEAEDSTLMTKLEENAERVLGGTDWTLVVGDDLRSELRRFRSYDVNKVSTLLRAIRNKRHHYHEIPQEVKASLGSIPDGYMAYFRDRFPLLLPHVHRFIAGSVCAQEPLFSHYFAVPSSIT